MNWLVELVKHLKLSKLAVLATFTASLVVYAGPLLFPERISPVPKGWEFAPISAAVASGTILIGWVLLGGWRATARLISALSKYSSVRRQRHLARGPLDVEEVGMLQAIGRVPGGIYNLSYLDYDSGEFTRLEAEDVAIRLQDKGLIERAFSGPYQYKLTEVGRQRALALERRNPKLRMGDIVRNRKTGQHMTVVSVLRSFGQDFPPVVCKWQEGGTGHLCTLQFDQDEVELVRA